jgi:hypothetical protein
LLAIKSGAAARLTVAIGSSTNAVSPTRHKDISAVIKGNGCSTVAAATGDSGAGNANSSDVFTGAGTATGWIVSFDRLTSGLGCRERITEAFFGWTILSLRLVMFFYPARQRPKSYQE